VIGSYDIVTNDNNELGQKLVFRNSYDKSMSFAFAVGACVFCCSNGVIKGDFQYKRAHRGILEEDLDTSSTLRDITEKIEHGMNVLQDSFNILSEQMDVFKHFEIAPNDVFKIIGKLFFEDEVLSVTQVSIVKKELEYSNNFRHLGDLDFTAFDLYNHITEALKTSHPRTYISNHIKTHKLFEDLFI
jgi:hypothetical protein